MAKDGLKVLADLGAGHEHCLIIPDGLESFVDATRVMRRGDAAIFHKLIRADALGVEFMTRAPCLCFVINGRESFRTPAGDELVVRAGEMIMLPRNIFMVSDFLSAAGPLEAFLFFFDQATVSAFTRRLPVASGNVSPVGAYRIAAQHGLAEYVRALSAVYRRLGDDRALLQAKLIELLHLVAALDAPGRLAAFLRENSADAGRRNIRHLVRQHGDQNLSVQDFARLSGRSVSGFNRAFRREFGVAPSHWLAERRLERAREALLASESSVTEIGLAAGYTSTSHFIARFKARFGMTPRQMRVQQG